MFAFGTLIPRPFRFPSALTPYFVVVASNLNCQHGKQPLPRSLNCYRTVSVRRQTFNWTPHLGAILISGPLTTGHHDLEPSAALHLVANSFVFFLLLFFPLAEDFHINHSIRKRKESKQGFKTDTILGSWLVVSTTNDHQIRARHVRMLSLHALCHPTGRYIVSGDRLRFLELSPGRLNLRTSTPTSY